MQKLKKSDKCHLIRIVMIPGIIGAMILKYYLVALVLFCLFWGLKLYAHWLDRNEQSPKNAQ